MRFDDGAGNRQAEAGAGDMVPRGRLGAEVLVEQRDHILGGDPHPLVGDADRDLILPHFGANDHQAARG